MGASATYVVTREAALKRVFKDMTNEQLARLLEVAVNDDLLSFTIDDQGEDDQVIS